MTWNAEMTVMLRIEFDRSCLFRASGLRSGQAIAALGLVAASRRRGTAWRVPCYGKDCPDIATAMFDFEFMNGLTLGASKNDPFVEGHANVATPPPDRPFGSLHLDIHCGLQGPLSSLRSRTGQ